MNTLNNPLIGVFVEHTEDQLKKISYELLGEACHLQKKIGGSVVAILLGSNIKSFLPSLQEKGADAIIMGESPLLKSPIAETYTESLNQILDQYNFEILLLVIRVLDKCSSSFVWRKEIGPCVGCTS